MTEYRHSSSLITHQAPPGVSTCHHWRDDLLIQYLCRCRWHWHCNDPYIQTRQSGVLLTWKCGRYTCHVCHAYTFAHHEWHLEEKIHQTQSTQVHHVENDEYDLAVIATAQRLETVQKHSQRPLLQEHMLLIFVVRYRSVVCRSSSNAKAWPLIYTSTKFIPALSLYQHFTLALNRSND